MRVSDGAIRVDGRLDDEEWGAVPMLTDFTQKEPVEVVQPTDRMEVRFAYVDAALYVTVQYVIRRTDTRERQEFVQGAGA